MSCTRRTSCWKGIGLILQCDLNQGELRCRLAWLGRGIADIAERQGSIPPTIDGSEVSTTREPFGPVLSIPAFNFPMTLAMRSIGASPSLWALRSLSLLGAELLLM